MLYRLRTDFQLAIITFFGACAVLGILPFAAYRFFTGAIMVGMLDMGLVIGISAAVIYAWRTGNTKQSGLVLVIIYTSGAIVSAAILGVIGLFWMYAVLLSNFFLVSRTKATIASVIALGIIALDGHMFESHAQVFSFLATSALVGLLAYILAYHTEEQRSQLETLATHDALTGVGNRRAMEQELIVAIERHKRDQTTFGLIMLDLDHFKRVNDQFGHDAGDKVLIAFSDLIQKYTRKTDRFFRFGGEEFVLLLPGANAANLQVITKNLHRRIAEELHGPGGVLTVSFGAASLNTNESWQSWLGRADTALYQAKTNGRNRVIVDETCASET